MINAFSGKTHSAHTGLCVINKKTGQKITATAKTRMTVRKLDEKEIEDYVKTDIPYGKAGAYNLTDDFALRAFERIEGSYTNTIGLPLEKLIPMLKKININL